MNTRKPVIAGQFYPDDKQSCILEIEECLDACASDIQLPDKISGAIVPHAGWLFSGTLAAKAFSAVKKVRDDVDTFVLLGAAHSATGAALPIFESGCWETPLGNISVNSELAKEIIKKTQLAVANPFAHQNEHSIEVLIPFIQYLFPNAKIVPIIIPPVSVSIEFGNTLAQIIKDNNTENTITIASTDLTHYGASYGFENQESGIDGLKWAKEINDKIFINHALHLEAELLLESSLECGNACGPGAVAAFISCMKEFGILEGTLLGHTHSNEVMLEKFGKISTESVGYAAIVY